MLKMKRAFSLIEVLIVIAILGLIASLIVPQVRNNTDKAKYRLSVLNLQEVAKAMEKHYLEKGVYPVFASWSDLAAGESPLLEYLNDIPTGDQWGRRYNIQASTESEYIFEGFKIEGKLGIEYPDYAFTNGAKLKKKGKKD